MEIWFLMNVVNSLKGLDVYFFNCILVNLIWFNCLKDEVFEV